MNEQKCGACLFRDTCPSSDTREFACDHFFPMDDSVDELIDQYIEDRRAEFQDEWNTYLSAESMDFDFIFPI